MGGSNASAASWESRPGIGFGDPLISHYAPTSALGAAISLLCVMVHWNLPRLPGCCCPFHMAVTAATLLLRRLSKQACNPLWSPLTGWQCSHCTCMNREGKEACEQCGSERDAIDGAAAASGTPVAPDVVSMPEGAVGSSIHGLAADDGTATGMPNFRSRADLETYLHQAIGSAYSSVLDSADLDSSHWPSEGFREQGCLGKVSL